MLGNTKNVIETIYVGMDLHKRTSSFCVMDGIGNILVEKTIRTIPEEVRKFIDSLGKKQEIKLVMEPLSQWYFYADFIESLKVKVHLAHPLKVKAISSGKTKTDKIDAKVLAHLLRTNLLPEAYFAPKEVRNWKELVRGRQSQIDLIIQTKNKIHSILFRNALNYKRSSLFTKKGRKWLESLELNEYFKLNLDMNLRNLDNLITEMKVLEKKILEVISLNKDMQLLMTIPGIDKITAITIMSEIGTISRFVSSKKLQSFAGLVPTVRSSGGKVSHGSLSKQGSIYLRTIMIQAARHQSSLKHSVGLKWYYERLLLNKKNSKTAVVATARKLITIVYKVLSEQRAFEERLPKTYKIIPSI